MRWFAREDDWRVWFAFLPMKIGAEVIWLERYLYRFAGEYVAVKAFEPSRVNPLTPREADLFDAAWGCVLAIRGGGPLPHKTPSQAADAAQQILERLIDARNATTSLEA